MLIFSQPNIRYYWYSCYFRNTFRIALVHLRLFVRFVLFNLLFSVVFCRPVFIFMSLHYAHPCYFRHHKWSGLTQTINVHGGQSYKCRAYIKLLNMPHGKMYVKVETIVSYTSNGNIIYFIYVFHVFHISNTLTCKLLK